MASSTGPILVTGGVTWANYVLLADRQEDLFTATSRVGVATGLAAGILYGIEKFSADLARTMAWATLITVLFVRVGKNPTPMERMMKFVGD